MKWILSFLLLNIALVSFAQPDGELDESRKDKIETLKRLYISDKLQLTTGEAEKFWPVYNEFSVKRDEIKKAIRRAQKKMKEGAKTEKDALENIDFMTQKRKEEADLDATFLKQSLPVLGVEKTMRLAQLQKEFQQELVKKMKERRENGGGPGPGRRRN